MNTNISGLTTHRNRSGNFQLRKQSRNIGASMYSHNVKRFTFVYVFIYMFISPLWIAIDKFGVKIIVFEWFSFFFLFISFSVPTFLQLHYIMLFHENGFGMPEMRWDEMREEKINLSKWLNRTAWAKQNIEKKM